MGEKEEASEKTQNENFDPVEEGEPEGGFRRSVTVSKETVLSTEMGEVGQKI